MFNSIPFFSDKQLNNQVLKQKEFLRIIHPFLNENKFNDECIEIRPILREQEYKYMKSLNLWRLDEDATSVYLNFLENLNGKAACIYYSGFTFDYYKDTYKENGKKFKKGKINNKNSLYTMILPMDFDDIDLTSHEKEISKFQSLGIETMTIYTGHGYQDLILLNEKCFDKQIYKKFTYLLLAKGFKVDESIIDPARVLRLPHSFNCKAFDTKNKYSDENPEAIPALRVNTTKTRYKLDDIFSKIKQLETVNSEYEKKFEQLINTKSIEQGINDSSKKEDKESFIEFISIQDQYNIINFATLPEGIKNMLVETPVNYRNSVMMFLIPFFRNTLCLSLDKIIEVMRIWGQRCKPSLTDSFIEQEVKRIYSYNNKAISGKYSTELAKQFGYIDFTEYNRYEFDNKVKISNEFIEHYNIISDGAVRIYLMMKLFEKTNGIKVWNENDICKISKISRGTFFRNMKDLLKYGFIDKKRSSKKDSEKYYYYINRHYDKSLGFTFFNTSTLRMMVYDSDNSLNNSEIKAYTYITKMISNNPTQTCWASQRSLGEFIGKKRNTLTTITNNLNEKNYIKKDKYKNSNNTGYDHCIYTLLY